MKLQNVMMFSLVMGEKWVMIPRTLFPPSSEQIFMHFSIFSFSTSMIAEKQAASSAPPCPGRGRCHQIHHPHAPLDCLHFGGPYGFWGHLLLPSQFSSQAKGEADKPGLGYQHWCNGRLSGKGPESPLHKLVLFLGHLNHYLLSHTWGGAAFIYL